ncbi:hypothetical protein EZ456_04890 [Pedobacter psychrodurus]|uniref:Uncharacterized protein n=1 Tax=Pedobacter psychrodurus TaxID=2530456 RepID=A0A4R0PZP2_9SPHI|nr:hypothetical protein [Pedobacter psychrodurus]TCD28721.1 hypothetical protein EZ456_04890 [Pedobacter psychrodurus]
MKTLHQHRTFLFTTLITLLITVACSCRKDTIVKDGGMPGQAQNGPGGSDYLYRNITKIAYQSNGVENYIFQPSPKPKNALPVIAFQHAYNIYPGNQLDRHTGLINHLVKKGYTVIYDEFQPKLDTDPKTFENNAAIIISDGLKYIKEHPEELAPVALSENGLLQLGLIGYSVGGATSINLAANYRQNGIPKPAYLFTLVANNGGGNTTPMRDAGTIDPDTKVVIIDVEDDGENTFITSSNCWNQISQIPAANKQWIGVFSDRNPSKPSEQLKADHYSPASDAPDALDFNGYYKWATALANYSFYGNDYKFWWGNTEQATFMGIWGDGSEVKRAKTGQTAFWPGH